METQTDQSGVAAPRRAAAFLDRDGVLNRETGFVHRPDQFEWIAGAIEAVKLLNDRGYFVFVVTNQSGIARGYYELQAVQALHAWMNEELRRHSAHIDDFAFCPHHPDGSVTEFSVTCGCRKPAAGMITDLSARWPVEKAGSFLVGDRDIDLAAARQAGIEGHLFHGGNLLYFVQNIVCS